jgi:hypothetical protein
MPQFRCPQVGFFNRFKRSVLGFSMLACLTASSQASAQPPITFTPIEANTRAGASAGSFSRNVVVNQYGIFIAYVHKMNSSMSETQWFLKRSVDGGATFTTIEASPDLGAPGVHSTNTPLLQTDSAGNIYMIRSTDVEWGGDAYLRIYSASTNFAPPATQYVLPHGSAQKNSMLIDEARGQIYYIGETLHDAPGVPPDGRRLALWFYVMGLDGVLRANYRLTRACEGLGLPNCVPNLSSSYAQLALNEQGDLYVMWTNVGGNTPETFEHYSTHVMRNDDGGSISSWETLSGNPVTTIPVVADPSGPVPMINDANELGASMLMWSMRVKEGKMHLVYRNSDTGQLRYVRLNTATGVKEAHTTTFANLNSLDGFCTASNAQDHTVYCVGLRSNTAGTYPIPRLAVVASYDNGQTWQDVAMTDDLGVAPFGITGNPVIRDGHILGMITIQSPSKILQFFKIPLNAPRLQTVGVTTNAAAPGYPATNAIDSDPATQWVASLTPSGANNNAWIQIDLGISQQIHRIRWQGAAWTPYPAQSPADYTITSSQDGVNWTTVATRTNPAGVINGDESVFIWARYVRLTTTKVNDGSGWSLSFHEFWVEGLAPTRLPATAYGVQTPGYETALAVDGRYDTLHVWSLTPAWQNNASWIQLSFGDIKPISRLKWVTATGTPYPAYAPKNYVIQTSNDGTNWTTIVSRSSPHFMGDTVGSEQIHASARYLRVLTSQVADGTGWSLSFVEIWAEGW